jgi:nicotinate-nucleotide adenylyltransferase
MTTIALFGTSADPPTAAHKTILRWLSKHYEKVAVWASDNPFKSHQTSLEHRKRMLEVLISELDTPCNNIGVHEELSRSRTLETLAKAKEIWGDEMDYTLVVGSDLVNQIPRWYRIEELLSQVRLLVVQRPGYDIDEAGVQRLRQLGTQVAIADLNVPGVSSTAYREKGDSDVITPSVQEYINREKLYA